MKTSSSAAGELAVLVALDGMLALVLMAMLHVYPWWLFQDPHVWLVAGLLVLGGAIHLWNAELPDFDPSQRSAYAIGGAIAAAAITLVGWAILGSVLVAAIFGGDPS